MTALRLLGRLLVVGLLWGALRWLWRHRRWSFRWSLPTAGAWYLGHGDVAVLTGSAALLPAFLAGVWSTFWPDSYRRLLSGPWRRWCRRRWARHSWPAIARACGLSEQVTCAPPWWVLITSSQAAKPERRWVDPQLIAALTSESTLTLRVRARLGQSVEEIVTAAPKLRDAARAESVRCVQHSPSVLDIVLTLVDPLAGTRSSAPAAGAASAVSSTTPSLAKSQAVVGGSVVLGRGEDGRDIRVDPADPWHIAAQGATRSGKSALSYTLLGGLAYRADVLVCGVDPSGILLGPWQHGRGGAWIATGTNDMERAVEALHGVVAEMDRRITRLVTKGRDKFDRFDAACPLLLVVLEEYPGTLSAARSQDDAEGRSAGQRITPRIERAVGRLVKEGAKVGIRIVLLAQRMSAKAVDTDDRSNFGLRITLRVDNGDAVGMLHDGPAARGYVEAARQFPAGMGLVEGPGHPLQRWRADFTEYAAYRAWVADGSEVTRSVPGALVAVPAPEPQPAAETDAGSDEFPQQEATVRAARAPRSPRAPRKPRAPRAPRAPRQWAAPSDDEAANPSTGDAA
ncbi:FtsK/SpoIIIE domain-containing protein [Kineococcus arenarius]|uniref:FtsK/SpoIIIE domain-containing protein n=1 Tax=unclassified Kineococcus TaxID=2621656 RepID=UPI003D7EDBBE